MSRFRQILAALLMATLLLNVPAAAWENDTHAADVVAAALDEVGYTEGDGEYSKYGAWYGLSYSYWCAIFVSWAANEAGVPQRIIPRAAYCPYQVSSFRSTDRFCDSALRGGDYVPRQGDIIFFYNSLAEPEGNTTATHIGIVLYVENGKVFSIEGNALTGRTDLTECVAEYDDSMDPPDYVTVNYYPLDSPRILGYGVPEYGDRTELTLTGFVDLGNYAEQADVFATLAEADILSGTSSHTYSPRQGLSRGALIQAVVDLYGLKSFPEDTPAFSDVPKDHPDYSALMTARSLGIFAGGDHNTADPNRYVTGPEAQAILSRTLTCLDLPEREFSFTSGDYIVFGDYTIRAELAVALNTLLEDLGTPGAYPGTIRRGSRDLDWNMLTMDGTTYAPLETLKKAYPRLKSELPEVPSPVSGTIRVLPTELTLTAGTETAQAPAFQRDGVWYIALRPTADLLGITLSWDQPTGAIVLDQ